MRTLFFVLILAATVAIINGCKPSSKMTVIGSWANKDKIKSGPHSSVFILAITQNMAIRSTIERDLAEAAEKNGIKAVQSLAVFTPVTGVPDSVVIKALMNTIEKSGCTSILTVSLIDEKSETKYIPSASITYDPYAAYGYYGTFETYYATAFETYYRPGYYKTDNTYYIETNLYDFPKESLLFSVQTKALNPPEISKSSKTFTKTLVEDLKSEGLLKKQ